MARRLRERHLPHRIDITRLTGEGSEGQTWETTLDRPAYVEEKSTLVIDRRSTSPTAGQEIASTAFIVLLTIDDTEPRSLVTLWKGTPREVEATVLNSALFDYPGTPSHIELYI